MGQRLLNVLYIYILHIIYLEENLSSFKWCNLCLTSYLTWVFDLKQRVGEKVFSDYVQGIGLVVTLKCINQEVQEEKPLSSS